MNERDIFLAAVEITDAAERAAYIEQTCGADARLREQVEQLLEAHDETSQFLETPAAVADSSVDQTILTGQSDADGAPHGGGTEGEVDIRGFLEPTTRPGWLGRLAHYEIEEILGQGAFGIVVKAFDEKLHRVVAIKLMSPELASTSPPRKRFLREARTAAAVTHENIVAIHAVEEEPLPYLVMEYIAGLTLQQRMNEHGPLEVPEILRIGQQVAAGLAAAHAVHLIHRDIKPSNILLAEGPHERAKISDFGLARAVDDASLTSSGLIAGTPMYMAPEQARGETLDHRADLFSLGSVLYQMASGRPPFRAANTVAVLKRVCEDTPRPLHDVIPDTPAWLETIIFQLLEKDRDDRYQTAREVADLLARCRQELEHSGEVTCVATHPDAEDTLEFHRQATTVSGSRQKPTGWLVGGAIVVAAVIGLLLLNGGKETVDPVSITDSGSGAAGAAGGTSDKTSAVSGWHGWPADAPSPAIAPFDANQATAHQAAWAKYLGVPVEYENSLGMKFRLIPPGEFTMGSTPEEIEAALEHAGENQFRREHLQSEAPRHKVILTQPVYLGVAEVTQTQYEQVMGANPSPFRPGGAYSERVTGLATETHPAASISWINATDFCSKLSQSENLKPFYFRYGNSITQLAGTGYRLPTEAEWESACRAGTTTRFWSGDEDSDLREAGWFGGNSGNRTHVVGELTANPFGLFDIHGNVWEWVQDSWDPAFYGNLTDSAAINPSSPFSAGSTRVLRGGGLSDSASRCRSSLRFHQPYSYSESNLGFRVLLSVDSVKQQQLREKASTPIDAATGWHGWPADAPPPAIAPFNASEAKAHQAAWAKYLKVPVEYENSLGMTFRLIPPGEFLMGSTPEEIEAALKVAGEGNRMWREWIQSEGPQHRVVLTQPVYVSGTEVTQLQYEQVTGTNPSHFSATGAGRETVADLETGNHPVEMVSWIDAAEFCAKLSVREKLTPFYFRAGETVTPLDGTGYRLPTEAEWESACRAGTTTQFWSGDEDRNLIEVGWFGSNSGNRTHSAGELKANPFGLFDVHGNVREWVQDSLEPDFYAASSNRLAIDPSAPVSTDFWRSVRGGGWGSSFMNCRSSNRNGGSQTDRQHRIGFRVVLPVEAVKQQFTADIAQPAAPKPATWHGWPADAPEPAIAPFNAVQAKQHQEEWAKYLGVPVEYENSIGMKFRLVPPGEFVMGSPGDEVEAALKLAGEHEIRRRQIQSEAPQHKVILTRPVYIGATEVTHAQYEQVMKTSPSPSSTSGEDQKAADHPVETVIWYHAAEFSEKLSQREELKPFYFRAGNSVTPLEGTGYRLPTEAEWEFACRAGTTARYWGGDEGSDLLRTGWCSRNSGGRPHAVGELSANPFGLFDMHGNLWEWVQDSWDPAYYGKFEEVPAIDPAGPSVESKMREVVVRGGSCDSTSSQCRSSSRLAYQPTYADSGIGFRVVLMVDAVRARKK